MKNDERNGDDQMNDLVVFQQTDSNVRFEWGYEGVRALAPVSDIVVIIDVLSFTTCVDVILSREGIVFPYPSKGPSAQEYAKKVGAILAGKRGEPISLSPSSLSTMPFGSRIVLPSLNGATCSFLAKESKATVVAACFRNASSVACYAKQHGGVVTVIACGERWPDGSLRPSFEDMIAAGAILGHFEKECLSPEALSAVAAYETMKHNIPESIGKVGSGKELIAMGFKEDVRIASEFNVSQIVPILTQDGAFKPL